MGKKMCEQCRAEKDIELFRKVTNQYTGVHPMGICKECYQGNQEARQQKQAAEWEARKALREKEHQESEEERLARQERERIAEQKLLAQQQALEAWYLQQPDRQCVDCKQVFPASAFGYSMMKEIDGVWVPAPLHKRCKPCHEAYREGNRQIYPLCPMCQVPARRWKFLHKYRGYNLDLIKICCEQCIPTFEALPENKQIELLRRAMVKAYGETAVIYALQYDDQFPCQHIGRTMHYPKRMAEYKRRGRIEIKHHFILQDLSFGPLSMEYESRWMMHAVVCRIKIPA